MCLPLKLIEQQVKESIPSGAAILQKIKKRVKGWGPQESVIIKELKECGIDLETFAEPASLIYTTPSKGVQVTYTRSRI